MTDLYGAIDLGGTNVRAIVAGLDGVVCGDRIQPSHASEGLDPTLDSIIDALQQAAAEAKVKPGELRGIGICSAGWVDSEQGIVPAAPQLKGWRDVPLTRIIQERTGVKAWLENDANAAALGEHVFGAGKGARHLVYITVSTGIGGGIIADGKLYGGAKGSAGRSATQSSTRTARSAAAATTAAWSRWPPGRRSPAWARRRPRGKRRRR